jgi:NAD(P)H dehydrogenase (quinone)
MEKILITGATGNYGYAVIEALVSKGVDKTTIYAMARDKVKADLLKTLGVNIVLGDYNDYQSMIEAFSGIHKLLFVSSGEMKNRGTQHKQVVKAAKKSGVKHILYTSQIHNTDDPKSPMKFVMKSHLVTEIAIMKSGIDYTILRNGLYLDMLLLFLGTNVLENGIFLPAGNGKIAFTLRSEMAEVAANIITAEGHKNKIYDVAGKGVSFLEIASMIHHFTNKNITYVSPDIDTYIKSTMASGIPKEYAKMLGGFALAAQQGELGGINSKMEMLLERKPTSTEEFLEKMYR